MTCQHCGQPVGVHVPVNYGEGQPHYLCPTGLFAPAAEPPAGVCVRCQVLPAQVVVETQALCRMCAAIQRLGARP